MLVLGIIAGAAGVPGPLPGCCSDPTKTAQRKQTKKSRMQKCDQSLINQFDYSPLSPSFSKLAKPSQRGLLNNGIRTPAGLARRTVEEVTALHGVGPSAMPILREALWKNGMSFNLPAEPLSSVERRNEN
jgi:hypothetical protein